MQIALLLLSGISHLGAVQAGTTTNPPGNPVQVEAPTLPTPVAPSDQLTLAQALQLGLRINPQILAAASSVQSAKENYNSQKAPINPTLGYAALNNTVAPLNYGNGFALGSNYSIYATIETNGAFRYRTGQAREQYHQAQFDAQATGLSLKLAIVNAYAGLQLANRALEVELKVYANMGKLSDLTDKRFETGAGPQADSTRAKIAFIQEKQNVITDVANVDSARSALNAQLGRPQDAPIDVSEPLVYRPVNFGDVAALTKQAESNRPEYQSAVANLKSLQSAVGLQKSAYYPNAVLGKDFGSDGVIYVGLSIPIDLGGIRGSVSKAKADVKTQAAQVELERQSIDLDVKSSYINLVSAQKEVETYESGILKMSETLVDQIRHGYDDGANTIVDIVTAENTFRSVESAYYSAIAAYVQAVYTLKHSIGDLSDSSSITGLTTTGATSSPSDSLLTRKQK